MSGEGLTLYVDDPGVLDALGRLLDAMGDVSRPLDEIGEYFMRSQMDRFDAQVTPEGEKWKELSPKWLARKQKLAPHNAGKVLTLIGTLRDSMHPEVEGNVLEFGTNVTYARAQQLGRPEINLDPRPFLGDSAEDRTAILAILQDWLKWEAK